MTREECIKVLSILKAAYPQSYKGLTTEEANGTISIWAMQFNDVPMSVVLMAINKIISRSAFIPNICEIKSEIKSLYIEAEELLRLHNLSYEDEIVYANCRLNDNKLKIVQEIYNNCSKYRGDDAVEPSLLEMIDNYGIDKIMKIEETGVKRLK